MSYRTLILSVFFILLILVCHVSGQEFLDNYLEMAANNNPVLKARFHEYLAALESVDQAKGLPDPQLVFGYLVKPIETRTGPQKARISIAQMFPWFGTLRARGNTALQRARSRYERFEEVRSKLFFEVKSAYFELYFIEKAIAVTTQNIDILRTFKNLASSLIASGSASLVDQIRVEMELAEMENTLAVFWDKKNIQQVSFNALLNTGENIQVEIPVVLWDTDLMLSKPSLLDSIRLNNHRLKNMDHLIAFYRSRQREAKLSGMPAFSVGADYIFTGASDNPMADESINGADAVIFPRIGISLPIYRKKYNAMIREAKLLRDSAEYTKEDQQNELTILFEKNHAEYLDAIRRIGLFTKLTGFAEQARKILESEYATNSNDFEELLRMEKRWLSYSMRLERARSDKQASAAFIRFLMGN